MYIHRGNSLWDQEEDRIHRRCRQLHYEEKGVVDVFHICLRFIKNPKTDKASFNAKGVAGQGGISKVLCVSFYLKHGLYGTQERVYICVWIAWKIGTNMHIYVLQHAQHPTTCYYFQFHHVTDLFLSPLSLLQSLEVLTCMVIIAASMVNQLDQM